MRKLSSLRNLLDPDSLSSHSRIAIAH